MTPSHPIPFYSTFQTLNIHYLGVFLQCPRYSEKHLCVVLRNKTMLWNAWKMRFITGLNGKTLLDLSLWVWALKTLAVHWKPDCKVKKPHSLQCPPKQALLIAELFQIGWNWKMKQDWACVSAVRCMSGFCKLIKVLRSDKAELKLPFSTGYLMLSQITQFAMHCSFSLICPNFSWLEVPVHQKVDPAYSFQPPMVHRVSLQSYQCISMLTILRHLFRLTAHPHLVFFSETNFNGYCGPPAELMFRSAKVIYGVCDIFSVGSSPEFQMKNIHVSHTMYETAIWFLDAAKVQLIDTVNFNESSWAFH